MTSGIASLVITSSNSSDVPGLEAGTVTEALTVEIELSQGMAGPPGTWGVDRAFKLRGIRIPINNGKVSFDFSEANTFFLLLTEDVTEIEYVGMPEPSVSVRVQIYIQQDAVGGRVVAGWPAGTLSSDGMSVFFSSGPGALDSVVLDTFDGGQTVQLNLVGVNYLPI